MSLQGDLRDFAAVDVFQMMSQQRKTGVLEVKNGAVMLVITFKDGHVLRAQPAEASPDQALAAMLLRTGTVSEADLARLTRLQEETRAPLAALLVEKNLVAKHQLEQVTRLLSDDAVFLLFQWADGDFAFRPESVSEEPGDLACGSEMFLLDALRRKDEWPQVQAVLPSLALVPAKKVGESAYRQGVPGIQRDTGISAEGLDRLYQNCNGRLTARRVIDLSRLGTFQGGQGLAALLKHDLIEARGAPQRPRPVAKPKQPAVKRSAPSRLPWILAAGVLVAASVAASLLWLAR